MIVSLAVLAIAFLSCNDSKEADKRSDPDQALADSLQKEVDEGHNVGMARYGKLKSMKFEAERILDSISKLPAKAREAAAPLKVKLDSLVSDLATAKDNMDTWMREFDMDSALDNIQNRIKYLTEEKLKVGKVKESIIQSLQRADSVLRKNL